MAVGRLENNFFPWGLIHRDTRKEGTRNSTLMIKEIQAEEHPPRASVDTGHPGNDLQIQEIDGTRGCILKRGLEAHGMDVACSSKKKLKTQYDGL